MLFLAALLSQADADFAWTKRRALSLKNPSAETIPAGTPVEIELDLGFVELPGALAVARGGRRIDHAFFVDGRKALLAFPLAAPLAPSAEDPGYELRYGGPDAPPPKAPFLYAEDFSRAERVRIGGLAGGVRDGALVIRDAPAGRSASVPERVDLPAAPALDAFLLTFVLEADFDPAPGLALCLELAPPDPTAAHKPALELIERLSAEDVETRERAAADLIAMGPAALPALLEAGRAGDAETRGRVERILAALQARASPPLLRAGLVASEVLWRTASVGGSTSSQGAGRPPRSGSRRFRFEIGRDADGIAWASCDGQRLQRGELRGPIGRLSIVAWRTSAGPVAPMRLDNVFLRPFVDPAERPVPTLDVERPR